MVPFTPPQVICLISLGSKKKSESSCLLIYCREQYNIKLRLKVKLSFFSIKHADTVKCCVGLVGFFAFPGENLHLNRMVLKALKVANTIKVPICEITVESETIFSGKVMPSLPRTYSFSHFSSLLGTEERPLAPIRMYNNLLRILYVSKLGWFSLHIKIVSSISIARSEL